MTPAEKTRAYRLRHPERVKAAVAKYQASEKGKAVVSAYNKSAARKAALKKYNASDKAKANDAKYRRTDKNRICQYRYDKTPKGKLIRALRDRVRKIVKRGKGIRAGSAIRDLGCSIDEFKNHIEQQFAAGMSWDNYGQWHFDHIRPLASFDLSDRDQFLQAVHFTNYQPLWAEDNKRKAAKLLEAA